MKPPHVESIDAAGVAIILLDILFFAILIESGTHGSSICGGRDGVMRLGLLSGVMGTGGISTTSRIGVRLASDATTTSWDVLLRRWRGFVRLQRQQRIKQMIRTITNAGNTVASMILIVLLLGMSNPSGLGCEVAELIASVEVGCEVFVDDAGLVEELKVCIGELMWTTNDFDSDTLPSVAVSFIVWGPAGRLFGILPYNVRFAGENLSQDEALPKSAEICTCWSLSKSALIVYVK
jgi:hypothetical protein